MSVNYGLLEVPSQMESGMMRHNETQHVTWLPVTGLARPE